MPLLASQGWYLLIHNTPAPNLFTGLSFLIDSVRIIAILVNHATLPIYLHVPQEHQHCRYTLHFFASAR